MARALIAAEQIALDSQGKMQRAAPVDTGLLRSRISSEVSKDRNSISITWRASTPYAAAQDQGWINRNGKIIKFTYRKGGGAGYMSGTYRDNVAVWTEVMRKAVQR
jgi:hypothetical protein